MKGQIQREIKSRDIIHCLLHDSIPEDIICCKVSLKLKHKSVKLTQFREANNLLLQNVTKIDNELRTLYKLLKGILISVLKSFFFFFCFLKCIYLMKTILKMENTNKNANSENFALQEQLTF